MSYCLLVWLILATCNPNHSGVCEGPPISIEEQEEAADILRDLKARADTASIYIIPGV